MTHSTKLFIFFLFLLLSTQPALAEYNSDDDPSSWPIFEPTNKPEDCFKAYDACLADPMLIEMWICDEDLTFCLESGIWRYPEPDPDDEPEIFEPPIIDPPVEEPPVVNPPTSSTTTSSSASTSDSGSNSSSGSSGGESSSSTSTSTSSSNSTSSSGS